jgi:hypothetical protein
MDKPALQALIDTFARQAYGDWRGKTFAEFWDWFDKREREILAATPPESEEWMREQLVEITANCDDAGLAVPPERENDIIGS